MTGTPAEGTPANPDLAALHSELIRVVKQLDLALDIAETSAQIKAITDQIAAANARVTAVGRELFVASTVEIAEAVERVRCAIPRVEHSLADLARLDAFIADVTGMMKLVDAAVLTARMAG